MSDVLIVSSRTREVWMYENKRLLDRLAKMLNSAEVSMKLECNAPGCPDPRLRLVEDQQEPTSRVLQCGCKNRAFETRPGQAGRILSITH